MTYTKPEINILGDAAHVIQFLGKGYPPDYEPDPWPVNPAYDLDE